MKESKCWIDESTGKIMFEDVTMAIAFNIEKQEEVRDYLESTKKLKTDLKAGLIKLIPLSLRYEIETWETVIEVANEEIERLKKFNG